MAQPVVTRAISYALNRVRVWFSDPMTQLDDEANYNIPGLVVTLAEPSLDRRYVDLTTTGMVTATPYNVTVTSPPVVDDAAQTLATDVVDFVGNQPGVWTPGFVFSEVFELPHVYDVDVFSGVDFAARAAPRVMAGFSPAVVVAGGNRVSAASLVSRAKRFSMRAYRTTTRTYVWWTAVSTPDFAGAQSGYPQSELTNIVLEQRIQ